MISMWEWVTLLETLTRWTDDRRSDSAVVVDSANSAMGMFMSLVKTSRLLFCSYPFSFSFDS